MHYPRITSANFSLGGAKLILPANAGREEWLEARKLGFGASDASSILGLSKYGDRYSVWADKVGLSKEIPDNENMYWGRKLEGPIRERFAEESGYKVRRSGLLRSPEHEFMLYTPDGITEDGGLFEAKTLGGFVAEDWADNATPDHAYAQVQQGLAVTGRSHAWVCGLVDGRKWEVRRLERDEALINLIVAEEMKLWDMVLNGEEPAIGPYSSDAIRDRYPVARKVLRLDMNEAGDREVLESIRLQITVRTLADDKIKAEEKVKATASNNLAAIVADAEEVRVIDGESDERILTFKNISRFSTTRFVASEPKIAKAYTPTEKRFDWDEIREAYPDAIEAATREVVQVDENLLEAALLARVAQVTERDLGMLPEEIDVTEAEDPDAALEAFADARDKWFEHRDAVLESYLRHVPSGPIDEARLKADHPDLYLSYRGRQLKIDKPKTAATSK